MLILVYCCLGIMTLGGIYICLAKLSRSDPVWFYVVWMCFVTWGWYAYLKVPFEIRIRNDNSVEFRGVLKRTVLFPRDIESIKAWGGGMVKIRHGGGSLRLFSQMDGFHDFILTVRSLNPDIETKGC